MDEIQKRRERLEKRLSSQNYSGLYQLSSSIDKNIVNLQEDLCEAKQHSTNLKKNLDNLSNAINNFNSIVDEINEEFYRNTKLNKDDFKFIIFTATLHSLRWGLFPSDQNSFSSKQGERKARKLVPKKYKTIIDGKVPYDKVIEGMNGKNHRSKTLGHDPILGWIFGVHDILVNTMTTTDSILMLQTIDATNYQSKIFLAQSFEEAFDTVVENKMSLPIAVANQALHLYSDINTKKGIPIPLVNVVNSELGEFLNKYNYDFLHISKHFGYAQIIDSIIEVLHSLSKKFNSEEERVFHQVKTKQIIAYGNLASSLLNIAYTTQTKDKNRIDFAGYVNTIYKVISSEIFRNKVKKEFVKKSINEMV